MTPFTKLLLYYIIYITTYLIYISTNQADNQTATAERTNRIKGGQVLKNLFRGLVTKFPAKVSKAHITGKPKVTEVQILGLWK